MSMKRLARSLAFLSMSFALFLPQQSNAADSAAIAGCLMQTASAQTTGDLRVRILPRDARRAGAR